MLFLLVGCTTNPSKVDNSNTVTNGLSKETKYYKCDYTLKDSLIVILESGTDDKNFNEF